MNALVSLSRRAETLADRFGISCDQLLGFRFAVNVFLAATIVWFTLEKIADTNPIWAIASMVATCEPQPEDARRMFQSRMINVLVGCAVGFSILLLGCQTHWAIPFALAITVLISTYLVRIKTMWRQAPITAAVVIAAGISVHSTRHGVQSGLHRVAEVLFGSIVGILVSWMMSKVWLIKQPVK